MILLLNAHALLWRLADDPALDAAAARSIEDPANELIVSRDRALSAYDVDVLPA